MSAPPATLLVSGQEGRSSLPLAAAIAVEVGAGGTPTLLAELGPGARRRTATLLAAPAGRSLEESLRAAGLRASARGHLCHLAVTGEDGDPLEALGDALAGAGAEVVVAHLPGALWVPALESPRLGVVGGCLLVELPRQRSLAALATSELSGRGLRAQVATVPPSPLAARRALAGVPAGGRSSTRAARIARRLLGLAGEPDDRERGQALPAVLGAGAALIITALVLAAIVGAVTGKGRAQRAADLAALSAARSMRDDVGRLLEQARLPSGAPNPSHLSRSLYFARARAAAPAGARPRPGRDRSRGAARRRAPAR